MLRSISLLSLLAFVTACTVEDSKSQSEPTTEAAVALQPLSSCGDLDTMVREKERATMNKQLDAAIEVLRAGDSSACYESNGVRGMAVPAMAPSSDSSHATTPSSVSQTNNQVVGVDEADLVKTDGKYIYLTQGSELRIVAAWPAADAKIESRTTLPGTAKKLFVEGDRALVYLSAPRAGLTENSNWMRGQASDCTYGYDCDFSGDGTATKILIYDLTHRDSPSLVRTIDMPGSLIAARRIGNTVHTVASIGEITIPNIQSYYAGCGARLENEALDAELAKIEDIRARNNAAIDAAVFDIGVLAREGTQVLGRADCADFYRESLPDGIGITTLLSLDLTGNGAPKLANVLSRGGAVYASDSSLYMAVPHKNTGSYGWYAEMAESEASTVHRFRIGKDVGDTDYLASGIVPGHVLNQFAMDEYDGALRVATSKGKVPDPKVESVLSVLKQQGNALKTIGQVGGIAPTEDIRSVRFEGKRGYVVTFKKTDPLFVLDLADPTKPSVVGELKIPGFSTYMHPLDETHLLALGYEADDQGSFAFFNGIQLQIFDVTTPTDPKLMHKKVYGTRGSSSSALTDHLGFTFLQDRELLTLPMSICGGGGNGQYGTLEFSGVVALKVSMTDGFSELGRLNEPYPASNAEFQYGNACSDWWTDSNSVVQRTVVMDDFLYAISDNRVRIQNLTKLNEDVKVIDF